MNPIVIIICLLVVCFVVFFIVYSEEMKSRKEQLERDKGLVDDPKILFEDNQIEKSDLNRNSSEDSKIHTDVSKLNDNTLITSNEKYKAHPVNHQMIMGDEAKKDEEEESEDIEII